jgi:predicted SAM-dependent methyltransferase
MLRLNIGCGEKVLQGFVNLDNSPSLWLANNKVLSWLATFLGVLNKENLFLIEFYKKNKIMRCDLRKGLPYSNASVDIIYSSHVFEHLEKREAQAFLKEAKRCLRPDTGCLRLIVPSLEFIIGEYQETQDADYFVTRLVMATPVPETILQKLVQLFFGFRHHLWMYDTNSLSKIVAAAGFDRVNVLGPGETTMSNIGGLNLNERGSESIILECYHSES